MATIACPTCSHMFGVKNLGDDVLVPCPNCNLSLRPRDNIVPDRSVRKVKASCPNCRHTVSVAPEHIGRKAKCKACDFVFVIEGNDSDAPMTAEELAAFAASTPSVLDNPVTKSKGRPAASPPAKQANALAGVFVLVVSAGALFLCCGGLGSDAQKEPEAPAVPAAPYTVASEDLDETPGKTMVREKILVPPDINEADLRALLQQRYEELAAREGYQWHEHPTVVAVYAYPSQAHLESASGQWSGMLTMTPGDSTPRVNIHPSVGRVTEESDRFGLSEARRRDIFAEIARAEAKGRAEVERLYPMDYLEQAKVSSQYTEAERQALARRLGLTREQLGEIANEGLTKNWPIPDQ